jgi:cytochrome c556
MKRVLFTAAVALGVTLSLPAAAQFKKPEDAVKYRESAFRLIANHFGRINAMAQGKAPFDAKAAQFNAEVLTTLVKLPWDAFPSDSANVGHTEAKPEVWSQPDKFKAAAKDLVDNVAKLDAAARTGNLDQIKAAAGATGKSCKSCHETFKKD